MEHTRNMQEWMRAVERKLANNNRSIGHVGRTVITDIREELVSSDTRQPTFPIEVTYQTALYIAPQSKQQRARLMVDFPDVTKATDGTDIEVASYELWGRDDTMNALEATTSAVPGVLAPGVTFPGLAATQANKDISAKNQGPWKLLASSTASSLRAEGLVPGSVWSFKVRALGTLQKKPGLFSAEFQVQLDEDTEPPSQPTKPDLTSSMGTIVIRWDGLSVNGAMPSDFEYVNVAHGPTASPTAVVTRFYRGGGNHVLSGFDYYAPQFVRFQAVDLSGNVSAWSEQAVGFTTPLVDTDIILSEIDGNKTLIKNVGEEAIKDGAIRKEKLAAGAIDLSKLDQSVQDAVAQGNDALDKLYPLELKVTDTASKLSTAEEALNEHAGRLTEAEGQLTEAFGELDTVDSRIATAKQAAIDAGETYTDAQANQALVDALAATAYSLNPSFDDWTGATPNWFVAYGTGPTKETGLTFMGGDYAARFVCTDTTTARGLNFNGMLSHAPDNEYWTVELVFRLDSGTLIGSGVLLDWTGMTGGNRATLSLAAEVPNPVFGKWYKVVKTLQRPATAAGTWTGMDGYLMANFNASYLGGAMADKDITFDWLNIRPATAEEINAGRALTMAGSKSRVYYNTSPASGAATADGDLWRQRDASNNVIAEWRWDASLPTPAWVKTAISSEAISNLDVGKLTAGSATILTVVAQKIAASTASFQTVDVKNLFATSGTMDSAVITKLWADVVNSQKINTAMLTVGAFDNLVENPSFEDGGNRWGSYATSYWTFPKTGGNSGSGVCRFTGTTTRQLGPTSAQVPHEQGDSYRISGWVKTTAASGHKGELCLYWYDANNTFISNSNYDIVGATSTWSRFTFTYTPPSTARFVSVRLNATIAATTDEYFFDDIALTRATSGELLIDGSVTANKVAANAISAKNIVVGDFQNLAIGSDFEDAAAVPWNLHADHTITNATQKSGTNSLRIAPGATTGNRASYFNGDTRVREGDQWYVSFWARIDSSFNGDGNSKFRVGGSDGSHLLSLSYNGLPANVWTKLEGTFTVPAAATSLSIALWSTQTAGTAYIDDIQIRRVAEPSLIQSLGVEKLTAGSASLNQAVIDKLWADVVNSRKITAEMVIISSGANLFADPDIQDISRWSGGFATATGGMSGKGSILIPMSASQSGTYYGMPGSAATPAQVGMRLVAGAIYRVAAWVRSDQSIPANQVKIYLRLYDGVTTSFSFGADVTNHVAQNSGTIPANTWTQVTGQVKIPDDAGAKVYGVLGLFKQATFTTGAVRWSDPTVQQAAAGELIVDGEITTVKLGAEAVTAEKIKALAIEAGKIAANAVEADKIKAGAVTAVKLEAELALVTKIIAGPVTGTHAEMNASGFKVFAEDPETGIPYETVRMGVADTSDLLSITNSVGESVINLDSLGTIAGKSVEAENTLFYKGEELSSYVGSRPRGMAAWAQVEIKSNMAVSNGTVGLFELAWDGGDIPGRMYEFNVNTFIVNASAAGTVGMRLFFTTDGSAPTINSPTMQYNYIRTSAAGFVSLGGSRIVGSNNGNYIRVLVALYASSGVVATVTLDPNQTHLLATVMDLGESMPPTGVASTGGGTPYSGSTVAPPTIAKVTKTLEYGYTSVKSYLPNNSQYQYNIGKAYQGLSPAGYGNLRSIYSFNQDFVGLLNGATIEGVWIYIYFEHWYYNAGGSAIIRLHNQSGAPATYTGVTGNGFTSSGWPKAAGRWVSVPSNLWAGFASGAYKGFALIGDSSYGTYGIANNARLKFKFTK